MEKENCGFFIALLIIIAVIFFINLQSDLSGDYTRGSTSTMKERGSCECPQKEFDTPCTDEERAITFSYFNDCDGPTTQRQCARAIRGCGMDVKCLNDNTGASTTRRSPVSCEWTKV